ncbi:tetratricopeptide repeat protein [Rhodoferax sp.]|uniref:tetratricopeptide repeat protein n=1 Tax=Rhodoferax sp. TaxID=50421 RepID=UPI002628FD04|nr:tetratricopeptide repeat protein [Rhodoferax sp.]MDD2810082.1 tetratricopeptide repeat protein [Rhodoferax sp.]MDD4942755.1 tetratricopeptide repeat protein [Rhodoferax sp.]
MKLYPLIASLATGLILMTSTASAQEAAWQNSYQLEAAGKYTEALAAIDGVPANGPDAELKALRRGWLYYLPGRFDESIREYRLAIERNPKSVDARLGLTLPLLAAKRWRDAEQSAQAALNLAPNNYTALLRLVIALEAQKDWAIMAKVAANMVSSYPTDASAYVYLARANAWLGKRDEAVAAYTAALSRYPGHVEAKAYLAQK